MKYKNLTRQVNKLCFTLLMLLALNKLTTAQQFDTGYYRISQGNNMSLDIINDGKNNQLTLAATSQAAGQYWKITPVGNGYYRLTSLWQGAGKSIDIKNDGINNTIHLTTTANVTGQFWKITPVEKNIFRLTTLWQGDGKSMSAIAQQQKTIVQLSPTATNKNQLWQIQKIENKPTNHVAVKDSFITQLVQGFRIMMPASIAEQPNTKTAIGIIADRLTIIQTLIKPTVYTQLQKIPIWLEYKQHDNGAVWYHSSKGWLTQNGYPASLEKSIEVKNISNFIAWQKDQPFMLLHELAHAYYDMSPVAMQQEAIKAYKAAVAGKKYESVPYINGGKLKHYALNNEFEYFAECTEAYFGKNDYYPFNRSDLEKFDPQGYAMIKWFWKAD